MIGEKGRIDVSDHYFLAFPVPQNIGQKLKKEADRIQSACVYRYWTDPGDYHVTYFFFGQTLSGQLQAVDAIMTDLAKETRPFVVTLSKISWFGKKDRPRVVYAGFFESGALDDLRRIGGRLLMERGFSIEKRPYHPHITLAKKWVSGNPFTNGAFHSDLSDLSWEMDRIVLYRVHPYEVPRYIPVKIFRFYGK
ncbi:RNA 2',3'-cyclic phosphodiesterase [Sporolactobacillus sp. THM7-7]|nr:RNA 2',3'-cyclic phosphodiesterase [Sporolactobacillus sp. THM7-7]